MVKCQLCGREFKWINNLHLRIHNISLEEYIVKFPNAEIISEEVRKDIRESFTEERREKASKRKKGIKMAPEIITKIVETKRKTGVYKRHSEWMKQNNPMKNSESRKKVSEAEKGKLSPLKGKTWEEYYGKERADELKNNRTRINNPFYGCHHSQETTENLSEIHKLKWQDLEYRERMIDILKENKENSLFIKDNPMKYQKNKKKASERLKKNWENEEFREKAIKASLKATRKRPTSYEEKVINISTLYNFPFEYVGDGKVIVGKKNPDFIETSGNKLIIETYCNYWHEEDYEENRSKTFKKYGYNTLFLNDIDLNSKLWLLVVSEKIANFIIQNKKKC